MTTNEGKTTYKKPSLFSATRTLKRFFDAYPEQNTMNKSEMLSAAGRDTKDFEDKNEGWLSGKLTALYSHSLVKPVYSYDPWKKLEYVELTSKGKTALNRDDAPEILANSPETTSHLPSAKVSGRDISIDDVVEALPKINEKLKATGMRLRFEEIPSIK